MSMSAHRDGDDDGRDGIDLRREALADRRIDLNGQRRLARCRQEVGHHELVKGHGEGKQRAGDHARHDPWQCHAHRYLPLVGAERARGLLKLGGKGLQPRGNDNDHVGQRERNVAKQDGMQPAADADGEEEDEHRRSRDQPRYGDRRKQQRLQQLLAAELIAEKRQRSSRSQQRRDHCRDHRDLEAVPGRGEQLGVARQVRVPGRRPFERQLIEWRALNDITAMMTMGR